MRRGYVVPADHKHVAWLVVAEAIVAALQGLKLEYPEDHGRSASKSLELWRKSCLQAHLPKGQVAARMRSGRAVAARGTQRELHTMRPPH